MVEAWHSPFSQSFDYQRLVGIGRHVEKSTLGPVGLEPGTFGTEVQSVSYLLNIMSPFSPNIFHLH